MPDCPDLYINLSLYWPHLTSLTLTYYYHYT